MPERLKQSECTQCGKTGKLVLEVDRNVYKKLSNSAPCPYCEPNAPEQPRFIAGVRAKSGDTKK